LLLFFTFHLFQTTLANDDLSFVQLDFKKGTSRSLQEGYNNNPNFVCMSDTDCYTPQGSCQNGACVCMAIYAGYDCSHLRSSQGVSFILSFFFGPSGADRFYLGYYGLGAFKLVLTLLICTLPFLPALIVHIIDRDSEFAGYITASLFCTFLLATFIWWMVDWIMIVTGVMVDSLGYALYLDF